MVARRMWSCWLMLAALLSASVEAAESGVVVRSVKGEFADVKENVLFAVQNRGLVLNYTSHIGAMLARTGKDIGRGRVIFRDAELLEFCSAAVSRGMMEADPHNIVFCPYSMAVYTLPGEPGTVYVGYRKPPATGSGRSAQALRAVGRLLDEIADEALK